MSPPSRDVSWNDARRVRLSWPGGARQEAERPEIAAPPPRSRLEAELPPDGGVGARASGLDLEATGAAAVRRALIDAYDRLADRLLQRLRSVGEDMDADLAELRSEMAALRRSVEDLDQRAQLRQLRSWVEEIRSDVAAVRRAALDPADRGVSSVAPTDPEAGPARDVTQDVLARLESVRAELAGEIASLRRRIALRAGPDPRNEVADELIARIADAVAARLASEPRRRR